MAPHERFEYVDQEARDLANRAIGLIEAHERVCVANAAAARDWRERTGGALERIERGLTGVQTRIWLAAGGLMSAMLGVIFLLAQKLMH